MKSPNFDRIARAYRWMEYVSFGPLLERCREEYLKDLNSARHALVLGDGDGRFTARLLATNPDITVDAVDVSATMLSLLQQRASAQKAEERIRLHQTDIRTFSPQGYYDLVVTHFFLDCLTDTELQLLIQKIKTSMPAEACWVVSEFAIPDTRWTGKFAAVLIAFLYRIFALLTGLQIRHLPNHRRILHEADFILKKQRQRLGGILVSEFWQKSL